MIRSMRQTTVMNDVCTYKPRNAMNLPMMVLTMAGKMVIAIKDTKTYLKKNPVSAVSGSASVMDKPCSEIQPYITLR